MPIGLPDGEQIKIPTCDELAAAIVGRADVQGFMLKRRIVEVEAVLRPPDSPWRGRLRESHPEVCFASLRRGPHGEPAPAVLWRWVGRL